MKFEDLKPGDKFYMTINSVANRVYVKTRYDDSKTPLRYRDTNAVRLDDGHCVVIGCKVNVVKI